MQLYSLTGVPPERQKVLVKGGQLKDDTDVKTLNFKPNQSIMMLGTAGELPKEPAVKPQFAEDMSDQQLAQVQQYPNGLINTGNTCYLNSTIQALRQVPELEQELKRYNGSMDVASGLRDLYRGMSSSTDAYLPIAFINTIRQRFPQFAERGNDGHFKQQDAEEAWSQILHAVGANLKDPQGSSSFVDKYFGGTFKTTLRNDETDAEPEKTGEESFVKLNCFISKDTNFLRDGLMEGLSEKIEKRSDVLDRNAQYTLTKKVDRLPKYLTVHFVRFFWKRDVGKKSKILRKVTFPMNYDATELCTPELRDKLVPAREKYREVEKEKVELQRAAKRAKFQELEGELSKDVNKEGQISESKKTEFQKQLAESVDPALREDPSVNSTGLYELIAVVTHAGASADSGHYQTYAKNDKEEGKWWRYNDDKVSLVGEDKVEALAGGGESDSALLLLYRAVSFTN
uniref:Ubiquitin carboxyl-terminal hydrolase n=1 Tax=Blastobotrys adeninivorans TaxID=409370 RepID=A0A060TD12_BLAAD